MSVINLLDAYKVSHKWQYPENTTLVYSNLTSRASRLETDYSIFFGLQYFIKHYLIERWNKEFFNISKDLALKDFRKLLKNTLNVTDIKHYEELHDLGYLPIEIKALEEGTKVPLRVPSMTIVNTHPRFYWVTNMLETVMSAVLWGMINNATVAHKYSEIRKAALKKTGAENHPLEQFLNHNFAYRGMFGNEAAIISDAAWLLYSKGSDTLPGVEFMETFYNADSNKEIISMSIPATEHSVTCAGGKDNEQDTFHRMIDLYKDAGKIFSFVSDTWDYFKFINETLRTSKSYLLDSGCKCVIRPDSSKKTPLEIICGDKGATVGSTEFLGSLNILWDIFGGSINDAGFKVLHPQIGLIYGEAISPTLYKEILNVMYDMGYCASNLTVGVGSFSQTYQTRDSLGQAIKATYTEVTRDGTVIGNEIFKNPATDDGTKKSLKGLISVEYDHDLNSLVAIDQVDWVQESGPKNLLTTVYKNGKLLRDISLQDIRTKTTV